MPQPMTAEDAFNELYGKKKPATAEEAFSTLYGDLPQPAQSEYKLGAFTKVSSPSLTSAMQPNQPYDYRRGWPDPFPLYSQDMDRRRQQMFEEDTSNRPDLQAAQQYRTPVEDLGGTGPALSGLDRFMTSAQGASILRNLPARIAMAAGMNPDTPQYGLGATIGELANEPQLAAETLQALPPKTIGEGIVQGAGTATQTGLELFTPGSPVRALGGLSNTLLRGTLGRAGLNVAERGLLGHAASLSLAAPGYQAPGALSGYLGGELTGAEALGEVAASPVTLPYGLAKTAIEAPQDIYSGSPERVAKGVGEAAVLALPFLAGKRGRKGVKSAAPERRFLGFLRGDVELPKKIGNIGPEMYAQDMMGVVERQGGPYGRAIANRSREAVDLADRIEGGQQNRILEAEQLIRRSPSRVIGMGKPAEATAAYNELAEPRWNENVPSAGFSGLMDAVEYGGPLGQRAQAFADRYNNVVRRNFRIGQSLGTSMRTLRGDLVNLGGKTQNKFIRVYTPDAYQIYQHKGKVYREFVDTISKLNGIKFEKAEQVMEQIFNPPIERTVAIEKARAIKIMPTHFKASDGRVYQIMEADPIKALRGSVRNMADKIALNNRFGPGTSQTDIAPSTRKSLVELRGQFAAGKGVPEKVFNKVVVEIKKAYQSDNEAIGKKWGEAALARFKKSGGKEADFETLKNMVQGGLQRRGNRIQQLRAKFAEAGGDVGAYDNLIRTLSNRPVGTPDSSRSSGGKFKDAFKRVASGLEGTYRSLLLTGAAPAQIFETLGATAPMVGIRASMKAMARLSSPQRIEAEREILRRMGAITTEQMNIRLTEGSKIEDYFRLQNKLIRTISGFDPVNEANETVGAAMGRAFSERIRKGNISATDRARLAGMGYEQRQIDRLSTGKASNAEYDAIVRRVAKLQGTTLRRSEQSQMANSPIWRAFAPFQNYFQNTIRQTNRMASSFVDAVRSKDAKRIAASSRVIAESALGRTLQGAGTLYIISLLSGKDTERGKKVGETPLQYVANNIGTAMWGGTLKSIASFVGDATFGGGVSSENALNKLLSGVSAPYRMLATALDAATGSGRFQGMSESERALELIRSSVPATKAQKAYLAATGMQDPVMESAVSRYWQWFFDKNPAASKEAKPDNAAFNRKIKNAVIALRNGRKDEASAIIDEALAAEPDRKRSDAWSRMSGKKLLYRLTEEQLVDLENNLGPKHFEALKRYDALIDNFNWSSPNAGAFFGELARLKRMEKESGAKSQLELKAKMGDGPYRKLKRFEAVERSLREARSAKDRFGSGHYQDTIDRVLKEQFERQE